MNRSKSLEINSNNRKFSLLPEWLSPYTKSFLKFDLIAGAITAAVVIPKAMAYATVAGLPVEVGLYTVLFPMAIYAFFGSSRPLSVSTTTTLAILTATELGKAGTGNTAVAGALATLTFLVGIMLLLASLLRLGFIANFISEPVLIGFKAGIGLVIIFDQIPKLLGIHIDKGTFIHNLISIFKSLPETSLPTLTIGIIMILLLVGLKHYIPKAPAPLIVVAIGIAAMGIFNLQDFNIAQIGHIPSGLPEMALPDFSLVEQMWPGALGIALMSFTETIAAGRAFAMSGEPLINANKELLATGLSNAGSSIFGTMPSGGGTSQTSVNRVAGARTQLASLVTAIFVLLTMLLLAPFLGMMPQATLSAVVIIYSIGLIQPKDFRTILNIRKTEFIWALAAFIAVILLGTLKGIIAAIIVSLIALASQIADPPLRVLGRKPGTNVFRPQSDEHPEDEQFPGLLILRPEGRVFFVNAARFGEKIRSLMNRFKPRVVILDFSAVPDLEYTALKMLAEAEKKLKDEGISVWLVGLNPEVLNVINKSGLGKTMGREQLHFNMELAVKKFVENTIT
jgi:sulfate permease, SulP family